MSDDFRHSCNVLCCHRHLPPLRLRDRVPVFLDDVSNIDSVHHYAVSTDIYTGLFFYLVCYVLRNDPHICPVSIVFVDKGIFYKVHRFLIGGNDFVLYAGGQIDSLLLCISCQSVLVVHPRYFLLSGCCFRPLLIRCQRRHLQPLDRHAVVSRQQASQRIAGLLGIGRVAGAAQAAALEICVIVGLRRLRLSLTHALRQLRPAAQHAHGGAQQEVIAPLGQIVHGVDGAFSVVQSQQPVGQRIQQIACHFLHAFARRVDHPRQQGLSRGVLRQLAHQLFHQLVGARLAVYLGERAEHLFGEHLNAGALKARQELLPGGLSRPARLPCRLAVGAQAHHGKAAARQYQIHQRVPGHLRACHAHVHQKLAHRAQPFLGLRLILLPFFGKPCGGGEDMLLALQLLLPALCLLLPDVGADIRPCPAVFLHGASQIPESGELPHALLAACGRELPGHLHGAAGRAQRTGRHRLCPALHGFPRLAVVPCSEGPDLRQLQRLRCLLRGLHRCGFRQLRHLHRRQLHRRGRAAAQRRPRCGARRGGRRYRFFRRGRKRVCTVAGTGRGKRPVLLSLFLFLLRIVVIQKSVSHGELLSSMSIMELTVHSLLLFSVIFLLR